MGPVNKPPTIHSFFPSIIALVVGLLGVWFYGSDKVNFPDANDYLVSARAIYDGTLYPRRNLGLPFFRAPMYPLFISFTWHLFPSSIVAIKIFQAILHALTCWILVGMSTRILPSRASSVGAILFAVNPLVVFPILEIQSETLHTFLMALCLSLLLKFCSDPKKEKLPFLFGMSGAAASLCRPTAFVVVLALLPIIWMKSIRGLLFDLPPEN